MQKYLREIALLSTVGRCIRSCFTGLNHDQIDPVMLSIMQLQDISSVIPVRESASFEVTWQVEHAPGVYMPLVKYVPGTCMH